MKSSERFIAFSYADYRLLWFAQVINLTGTQMKWMAVNWHVYLLTHSALALGVIGLTRFVPIVLCSLIGGAVADTHNRKKIIILMQSIMGMSSFLLFIATITHVLVVPALYICTVISTAAQAFNSPASTAFLPQLVKKEHLPNALSFNFIVWQIAVTLGPTIGGFIIGRFGVNTVYAIDVFTYISIIVALLLMSNKGDIVGEKSTVSVHSIKQGFHFLISKTIIWSSMILDFFSTFFASAMAMLPIYAHDILHVGPEGLGFLYAAPALGGIVAGLIIAHRKIVKQGLVLLLSVVLYGFATIVFGWSHYFWLSLTALFLLGVGDSISTIIRNVIRQLETPDNIRGRLTSIMMIFYTGGPQLGEFEAGVVASLVGAQISVMFGGAATLLVVAAVTYWIPVLRNYQYNNK